MPHFNNLVNYKFISFLTYYDEIVHNHKKQNIKELQKLILLPTCNIFEKCSASRKNQTQPNKTIF